jgi:hypothetical protein
LTYLAVLFASALRNIYFGWIGSGLLFYVVTSSPGVNAGASTTGGIPRLAGIEVSRCVRVTGLWPRPRSHRW